MIDYHRRMLMDRVRNDAFAAALQKVIVRGVTTVADIGAGTGILSFMAIKLGAKKCYLYEQGDVLKLAKKLAAENGCEKQCVFVEGHSLNVKNPPQVDLVVSETLGNFAYEEHIIENLDDAKRYLKPGGTMMPCSLTQFVAPVTSDHLREELIIWRDIGHGLTFKAAEITTFNNVYVRSIQPEDLLGGEEASRTNPFVRIWDRVRFPGKNASRRKTEESWTIDRPATVYAFAVWWETELVPGITLSTAPSEPTTHWEQILLPLRTPLELQAGDTLELHLHSDSRWDVGINVQWRAEHHRAGKQLSMQEYDMKKGRL